MRSFVITIPEHEVSQTAADKCIKSFKLFHNWPIEKFNAITPKDNVQYMKEHNLRWNYPWQGEQIDIQSGLTKKAYMTRDKEIKISCALSHYSLWKFCFEEEMPILVLEHDAYFLRKLNLGIIDTKYDIIGINDPRGATRRSMDYYDKIETARKNRVGDVIPSPMIDTWEVPQGLAGNSAYIITQPGAEKMLKLVDEYGLWHNDALMCRQLIQTLGVSTTHYTSLQRTQSTTV